MKRVGVIGLVIKGDKSISIELQKLLNEYGEIITGRMGVPDRESGVSAIALIVKGTSEEINALSGRLGRLPNINVKAAVTAAEI